jgi:C1A family cysteine protease
MELNKNLLKGLILVFGVLISLLICSGASAAEVSNSNHLSNLNDLKTVHTNLTNMKKEIVKKTSPPIYSNITKKSTYTKTTKLPAFYDLRKLGKLTPIKQQGSTGTCWAFAAIGSLESSLLPYETWDFSENNMKNLDSNSYPWGFDRGYNDGGCWEEATAYLTRYSGPVTSAQDPFNEYSGTSPAGLKVVKQ